MRRIGGPLILLLVFTASARAQEAGDEDRVMELGREVVALAQAEAAGELWTRLNDEMRDGLGSEGALGQILSGLHAQIGEPGERLSERIERAEGHRVYVALFRYGGVEAPVMATVAFTEDEQVAGLWFRPQPAPPQ